MIIIYRPEDEPEERFDARLLRTSEAQIVGRTIDKTWPEIRIGLRSEDIEAMRGVAWVLSKRTNPSLRFGQFDPGVEELVSRFDQREVAEYAAELMAAEAGDEELDAAFAELEGFAEDTAAAAALITELRAGPKDPQPQPVETSPTGA